MVAINSKKGKSPFKKFSYVAFFTTLFVIASTLIYYLIGQGDWTLFECFYMTVISVTTVGYGEIMNFSKHPMGRVFSMIVIVWGYILLVYLVSLLSELLVTGAIKKYFRYKKVKKMIEKLNNHYIVCGFGEMGFHVSKEIFETYRPLVIIDNKPNITSIVEETLSSEIPVIYGDASDENTLLEAGIEKASGMILTLPQDKDNMFVLITARSINPKIKIATKCVEEHNITKFKKAGAYKAITPAAIGGLRLASEIIRPTVTTFLDIMLRDKNKNLRIEEIELKEGMSCVNKTLKESNFKKSINALIMAVAFENGDFVYNPPSDMLLKAGYKLVVLGETKDIANFKNSI